VSSRRASSGRTVARQQVWCRVHQLHCERRSEEPHQPRPDAAYYGRQYCVARWCQEAITGVRTPRQRAPMVWSDPTGGRDAARRRGHGEKIAPPHGWRYGAPARLQELTNPSPTARSPLPGDEPGGAVPTPRESGYRDHQLMGGVDHSGKTFTRADDAGRAEHDPSSTRRARVTRSLRAESLCASCHPER